MVVGLGPLCEVGASACGGKGWPQTEDEAPLRSNALPRSCHAQKCDVFQLPDVALAAVLSILVACSKI